MGGYKVASKTKTMHQLRLMTGVQSLYSFKDVLHRYRSLSIYVPDDMPSPDHARWVQYILKDPCRSNLLV